MKMIEFTKIKKTKYDPKLQQLKGIFIMIEVIRSPKN